MSAQVRIECAARSHDPVTVDRMNHTDRVGWGQRAGRTRPGVDFAFPRRGDEAVLEGDAPVDVFTEAGREAVERGDLRTVNTFVCPKCGDRLTVRAERLHPILDVLTTHGLPSITLTALRARVNSS